MIKNEIEAEGLSSPKSIGILTVLRCISQWSKFGDSSLKGWQAIMRKAQNGINLDFKLYLTLKVKVDQPQKQKVS